MKHVYKGIPVTENGIVKHVQPVRSIEQNGVHYKGVKSVDSRGNEFVYNKVPKNN